MMVGSVLAGAGGPRHPRFPRRARRPWMARCWPDPGSGLGFSRHLRLIIPYFDTVKIPLDGFRLYLYVVKINSREPAMQQQVAIDMKRSNLAPIPMECDAAFLKVVGELPRELNGTLYRNGPNPQFEAPGAHWFVGDGMLHAFHLEDGRASYRNRWVRTPKWQAEHDAGRALFGGFGRRLPDTPASVTQDGGVANTNIIFHAGQIGRAHV